MGLELTRELAETDLSQPTINMSQAKNAEPVVFNNNVLRDGHQSLAATRMQTDQMLPACPTLDALGFGALETWGGATIDAGLRFLYEFPFDRLDALRKACPKTRHMMLLRGQNIVQYAHFPDDVVESFIKKSAEHGMDIFRIFDALNDTRNMKCAIEAAKAAGKEAHGTICYTTSPVHTTETFIEMGKELAEMGCDTIVIKDMAGLIPPYVAYNIVKGLKSALDIPVWIHTHETAGLGAPTYYAAIEAGVDAVDCSIVPFANGTAQPDTVRMLKLLRDHPRKPEYDEEKLAELREHFKKVYAELSAYTSHDNEMVDSDALVYQVPGGMLSNFRTQLKEQKMEDKFDEVFAEIPVVREALGWIPLVTPTSQIVGMQAFLNVKFGRWKQISPQAADIALGYYGRTPAGVDPEVRKAAAKQAEKEPITERPADLKDPGMEALRKQLQEKNLPDDDEHCVIHAMFPAQLETYYKRKAEGKVGPDPVPTPKPEAAQPSAPHVPSDGQPARSRQGKTSRLHMVIDGEPHEVTVQEVG
jgi:oxaloacetate decarboxylase alpha subunit/pyruvate carboxylase subunit B